MHTATVEDLKNDSASLLTRVQAGEEIVITQRGTPVARIVPETGVESPAVNWADSPAFQRDRSGERVLSAQESSDLIREARGGW